MGKGKIENIRKWIAEKLYPVANKEVILDQHNHKLPITIEESFLLSKRNSLWGSAALFLITISTLLSKGVDCLEFTFFGGLKLPPLVLLLIISTYSIYAYYGFWLESKRMLSLNSDAIIGHNKIELDKMISSFTERVANMNREFSKLEILVCKDENRPNPIHLSDGYESVIKNIINKIDEYEQIIERRNTNSRNALLDNTVYPPKECTDPSTIYSNFRQAVVHLEKIINEQNDKFYSHLKESEVLLNIQDDLLRVKTDFNNLSNTLHTNDKRLFQNFHIRPAKILFLLAILLSLANVGYFVSNHSFGDLVCKESVEQKKKN